MLCWALEAQTPVRQKRLALPWRVIQSCQDGYEEDKFVIEIDT
jgi:hypothetical protein